MIPSEEQQKLLNDLKQMVQGQRDRAPGDILKTWYQAATAFSLGTKFDAAENSWDGDGGRRCSEWTTKTTHLDRKWRGNSGRYRERR
jgi:hypothetical protein